MRFGTRARVWTGGAAALVLAFAIGRASGRTAADGKILGTFGVGGVLTESGKLFQYMPEDNRWMTIDDAFKQDGRETRILPLPVEAKDIRWMQSFGFLVTHEGKAWWYDLEAKRWIDVGTP